MLRQLSRVVRRSFSSVLVIHPFIPSKQTPLINEDVVYEANEALGLAKSLGWEKIPGPFHKYKFCPEPVKATKITITEKTKKEDLTVGGKVSLLGYDLLYAGNDYFEILPSDDEEFVDSGNEHWRTLEGNEHIVKLRRPQPYSLLTRQMLKELGDHMRKSDVQLLYLNTFLTPTQTKNIKRILNGDETDKHKLIIVIDRLGIILEIFNRRARSEITKMQVALVYLKYAKTQLIRDDSSTFISVRDVLNFDITKPEEVSMEIASAKQTGRTQSVGGEGESELEIQRRLAKNIESSIKARLEKSKETQRLQIADKPQDTPIVALVGYTNAGKSALMNCFAGKNVVESKNQLFQTLYTIKRKVKLRGKFEIQLIDTIGFINNLPQELIPAFFSTLESVRQADIVLHVRDVSHPQTEKQKQTVLSVLDNLGLSHLHQSDKLIEIRNKTDLLIARDSRLTWDSFTNQSDLVHISATKNLGITKLREVVETKIFALYGCYLKSFRYDVEKAQRAIDWFRTFTQQQRRHQRSRRYRVSR